MSEVMRKAFILLLAGALPGLVSCVDIPDYSPTPAISYLGVDKFVDVVDNNMERHRIRVTVSFEDGDGDLGEDNRDSLRKAYLKENGGWYNYSIDAYREVDKNWVLYQPSGLYLFPVLKPDGKKGPIRGKLDLDVDFYKTKSARLVPLKFTVKIRDRQLNESNVIETDTISVPVPLDDV